MKHSSELQRDFEAAQRLRSCDDKLFALREVWQGIGQLERAAAFNPDLPLGEVRAVRELIAPVSTALKAAEAAFERRQKLRRIWA